MKKEMCEKNREVWNEATEYGYEFERKKIGSNIHTERNQNG